MFSPIKHPNETKKKKHSFRGASWRSCAFAAFGVSAKVEHISAWRRSTTWRPETAGEHEKSTTVPVVVSIFGVASFRFLGESACEILRSARVRCSTRPAPRSVLGIKQNINAIFRCSIYKPLCMLRELFASSSVDFAWFRPSRILSSRLNLIPEVQERTLCSAQQILTSSPVGFGEWW